MVRPRFRSSPRLHPRRRLLPRVELLERRELLAVFAPAYLLHHASNPTPLDSPAASALTPAQLRHAYGFDQVNFAGAPGDGTGTTIAIVDAYDDPTIAGDLHQFDVQFGLPDPTFTKVNQRGGSNLPRPDADWADEIALDVEWSHAIAPGAQILLVEADNDDINSLFAAVDYAASQPGVVTVSMSWGGDEFQGETAFDGHFQTPAGHPGVAFVASSGDDGAPPLYPAISPNVLAVGGTTLSLSQSNYAGEGGWDGSGGGISVYETQPAFQRGVVTQSGTFRTNPDVAYDADPNTGVPVYLTFGGTPRAHWFQFGGTSMSAPQWAGLIAIADQGLALEGQGSLDTATQLLPLLYQLPASDFHDVTTGASIGYPGYSAQPGYDLVTGRGSPVANLLVPDLANASTTTNFQVLDGFESFALYGRVGGTSSTVYRSSAAAHDGQQGLVDYNGDDWFTRSDPGVRIKPGDQVSVWLQFAHAADGQAFFGFNGTSLCVVASADANQLLLEDNTRLPATPILGSTAQTYLADHWYRVQVNWASTNFITVLLYDSDGTTLLNVVTGQASPTAGGGGIAFRATGSDKYWDTVAANRAVTPNLVRPGGGTGAGSPLHPGMLAPDAESALRAALDQFFAAWGTDPSPSAASRKHLSDDSPWAWQESLPGG